MKIRKISIQNFRSLANIEVSPQPTTIFIGENNAGKSNLLHALRLLFGVDADRLRLDLSHADINDRAKARNEMYFTITIEIGDLQNHQEVETCFRERLSQDGDETYVTIQGKYAQDDSGEFLWTTEILPAKSHSHDPIRMTPRMQRSLPLYYLDAVRDAARDTRATGRGLLAQLLTEIDFADVEGEVQDHLREANAALNRGNNVSHLSGGLTEQLTPPLPGSETEVVLAVADEDITNLPRNFRLNLRHGPGGAPTDISRYGTGLHNLLLVSMFRHQVMLEQRGAPILAIEEPEAHLHPHAQRRLFKDLLQIDAPILLTTHAPAIAKYADPMSLVLLRCESNGDTHAFQLKTNFTPKELKDLARLMGSGRAELFFARTLIIVEGVSELISLPAFASVLGCDLDRLGISITPADGNDFAFILKACGPGQFMIPSVVVYDTDDLSKNNALLQEACNAGLITSAVKNSCSSATPDVHIRRKAVLDGIGWIGAEKNHEEEALRAGYWDTAVAILKRGRKEAALNSFLSRHSLQLNGEGLCQYFAHASKLVDKIKTLFATEVAEAAPTKNIVPVCYANAIRRAVMFSIGDIPVDGHFERRACDAGYIDTILGEIDKAGLEGPFKQFAQEGQLTERSPQAIVAYLTTTQEGSGLRSQVQSAVADAVEAAGCAVQAENIRNGDLPPSVF